MILRQRFSRRSFMQDGVGLAGLTLPTFFGLRADAESGSPAKSCIVIYLWGGIAHQESWDPKPGALSELRGEFQPISTATPGATRKQNSYSRNAWLITDGDDQPLGFFLVTEDDSHAVVPGASP
jgi:hypothetical protein